MTRQQYLRGDPKRPFPKDLIFLTELRKQMISPSHEPSFHPIAKGTASFAQVKAREYQYQSIENIEIMSKLGIHMPKRAHFFKGAGLRLEKESIERTIQYAEELHKRGMMVSVYVGGTIFNNYLFKEVPEAVNWLRKDQDGHPITYSRHAVHRYFPCLNHPDYRAYLKRVLDVAVRDVRADEIFFDNQILRHEPRSCRCELCVKHLNKMVRDKYTLDQCEQRYGFREYPDVFPPIWSQACTPWTLDYVRFPQIQDWIDHRISTVIEFYQEMAQYVKKQKPNTAVGMNIKGIHGHNRAFNHGICHSSFADILDFSCIDGYSPGYSDGVIDSEVRFYKSSHYTHIPVVDINRRELDVIEGQVYGYKKFIEGHGWIGGMGNCSLFTPMTQFMRANLDLYHERERLHDVAVFRSRPSTNYSCAKVHEQLMPFEETLAVEKIPWTIIFDHNDVSVLKKFRIVALPEIQAISDEWMDRLNDFMLEGGSVIASGKACGYDEWYRPRDKQNGIARWLGEPPNGKYRVVIVGKGRLVYVPEWDVVAKWKFDDWFEISGKKVVPVKNRKLFLKAIADAANEKPLTYQVTGNDRVFVEAIKAREPELGMDLHFINYDETHLKPKMKVTIPLPLRVKSVRITLIDPHSPDRESWFVKGVLKNQMVSFKMFTPRVYALAQIRYCPELA